MLRIGAFNTSCRSPVDAFLIEAAWLIQTGVDLVAVCHASGALAGVITRDDVVRADKPLSRYQLHGTSLGFDDVGHHIMCV
ncbi:hypothetical protein HYPDE_23043 [Hyphomicrobium denitrificans 1NES1]|uniref:CBS domain-containing protein n=1 Tax=Hyphomicrobium denitrificans 1NES1 TaxID=670307 RepID=N0B8A7_9HYPH|nr:hypothetical protein HYPDE_23043 [Hyphomicrobium denitrificans 1NES1]